MTSKSFISLSFSTKKLQIVQLHHSKKKVAKFTTIDLPDGLIFNHKVQNKEALAVVLKNVWKKLKLKEFYRISKSSERFIPKAFIYVRIYN